MLTDKRSRYARAILRIGGYMLALGLLAASVWYAMQGHEIAKWWILLGAKPWLTASFFATVVVSAVVVPGIQFWIVTRPFVTKHALNLTHMQALIAAGGLLNYTPFKAGLIGRIAFLKHIHGVGYGAAILTHAVIIAVFISSSLLTILVTVWRGHFDLVWWGTVLSGLACLAAVAAPVLRAAIPLEMAVDLRLRNLGSATLTYLMPCFAIQLLSFYCTAVRWWLVFNILDRPIALADAWMAAIVHMVSSMVGPANGIGLREWLIGIGGELGGLHSGPEIDLRFSMSAALLDRAVEALVLITLGLAGLAFLRRVQRNVTDGRVKAERQQISDR